jgi:hypothetical protein
MFCFQFLRYHNTPLRLFFFYSLFSSYSRRHLANPEHGKSGYGWEIAALQDGVEMYLVRETSGISLANHYIGPSVAGFISLLLFYLP